MIVAQLAMLLAMQTAAAPATLEITAKGCKTRIDGKRVPLDQLGDRVRTLGREQRTLQLRPEPGVTSECLMKVTAAIRDSHS